MKTAVRGISLIADADNLAKSKRITPYYRCDVIVEGARHCMTISVNADDAWRVACRFVARARGFKRTPSKWLRAAA